MIIKSLLITWKKKTFFSKLKNECPSDDEIQRTTENIERIDIKNREELAKVYLKVDVIFLADVFEKFIKISTKEYGISPLNCVSLPGFTYQCALK